MKTNKEDRKNRIIGRTFAKELTVEDLKQATGGSTSCCSSGADDCDVTLDSPILPPLQPPMSSAAGALASGSL